VTAWSPTGAGRGLEGPPRGGYIGLERDPQAVLTDVEGGYVTVRRAALDHGVVIELVDPDLAEYRIDVQATEKLRAEQRATRAGKLDEDPDAVAERLRCSSAARRPAGQTDSDSIATARGHGPSPPPVRSQLSGR
jgi:hypothetical protein